MALLHIINQILFIILLIPTCYFLLFAVAAWLKDNKTYEAAKDERSFIILIPAYKSDSCILDTARHAAAQNYPKSKFRAIVISDSMRDETNNMLRSEGMEVMEVEFENSTKAKSLHEAIRRLGSNAADKIVILDADNIIGEDFLQRLNAAFEGGAQAIQAHRTAKNRDTDIAIIDAASEEINNSIFRKGHNALKMSSALIGSGMAFDYSWFANSIDKFVTAGEDKEMELKLLRDGIFVTYLEDAFVLDEKTRESSNYYNQRRRWIASQYHLFGGSFKNWDSVKDKLGYIDKLFQWLLPPRMIILALTPLLSIIFSIFGAANAWSWWKLTIALVLAMIFAIPSDMMDRRLMKALLQVPKLAAMAFANFFRMRGTKDKFIHTKHE